MAQQKLPVFTIRFLNISPATNAIPIAICLVMSLGQALLMALNPVIGLVSLLAIALVALLFLRSELALPLYLLFAGPSLILSTSSSGILSRLYVGDLLFVLIVCVWLLRGIVSKYRKKSANIKLHILIPLICLAFIGLISIISSHLSPDPHVTYAFAHSDASILLVNTVEMFLLISLPLCIAVVPSMVLTLQDAQLAIGAYLLIGLPYALGTIFAGPLHLYSKDVILGNQRPEIFGASSSHLGILNVLFACLAVSKMLYAKKDLSRLGFGLLTCIYAGGVIMSLGRESWIGLLLAIWVILWFRFKSPIALLLPCIVLPPLLLFFPEITNFFNPAKVYGIDRINIWQDAIAIWQHSPYLGVGAGNFQFFDLTYGTDIAGVAHNQFLEVLAEMGIQGLTGLLIAIWMIGRIALKYFNTAISDTGKALALGFLGYFAAQLFATFFTDSFIPSTAAAGGTGPFILISYLWFFLGLVLSIPNWDHEAATLEMSAQQSK
jgi:O-antigen ligase